MGGDQIGLSRAGRIDAHGVGETAHRLAGQVAPAHAQEPFDEIAAQVRGDRRGGVADVDHGEQRQQRFERVPDDKDPEQRHDIGFQAQQIHQLQNKLRHQ